MDAGGGKRQRFTRADLEKAKKLYKTFERDVLSQAFSAWLIARTHTKYPLANPKLIALGDFTRRSKHASAHLRCLTSTLHSVPSHAPQVAPARGTGAKFTHANVPKVEAA